MPDEAVSRARDSRFCHLCGARLVGRFYRSDRGLVYCAHCHDTRPHCARCGLPLDDASLARPIPPPDDARLCRDCLRTTPRCAACRRHIVGTWYTFEELLPPAAVRRFCEACVRSRPRCDLCRVPVGPETAPLDDGQYRCTLCAEEMVLGDGPVRAVYDEALVAFARVVGEGLREEPGLEVVGRLQMGEIRRRYERRAGPEDQSGGVAGHHVLGFFVHSHGRSRIYVERGLPRNLLLGTLAHELAHAWQAERAPGRRDPLLAEGFAEWVAHHVLVASGLRAVAARSTRRDDVYGRGLRHMLEVEHAQGVAGVLAAAAS
jgi:hypothetical protein